MNQLRQQIVQDYRIILKHLRKLPSYKNNHIYIDYIKRHFKAGNKLVNSEEVNNLVEMSRSYATLLSSVSDLKYLRSLDSGEKLDPRELIRLTAAKVGFALPKFSDEERQAR